MHESTDPGWSPAVPLIGRILSGRGPDGSILLVMRAGVMLLGVVAGVAALIALTMGAGSREPRIDPVTARTAISVSLGAVVIAISRIGRAGPGTETDDHLALSVFDITMRRVLAAAALGPIGLGVSWLAGDPSYVIFGTGLALLFMAIAGPTSKRLGQFQAEVDEAGSSLSVLNALERSYR